MASPLCQIYTLDKEKEVQLNKMWLCFSINLFCYCTTNNHFSRKTNVSSPDIYRMRKRERNWRAYSHTSLIFKIFGNDHALLGILSPLLTANPPTTTRFHALYIRSCWGCFWIMNQMCYQQRRMNFLSGTYWCSHFSPIASEQTHLTLQETWRWLSRL